MPAKKKTAKPTPVASIRHKDTRKNIPTEELRDFVAEDEQAPKTMLYPRDPSLDPQLVWKGKDEQDRLDLAVPVVPIYIQEKIHPQAIIDALPRIAQPGDDQTSLFADFNGGPAEFAQKVEFYRHEQNWSNRMILGDSLLVMTSLAEKEGLKGKVQSIYFDPPYGIKFGSNWQVSTRKRDVKDGKAEDATRQPEQVRAFRDTWKLGIHSYLAYLRDRLVAARDLLTETGSVFVQIGDENVHLVRNVMDEVFGSENYVSEIYFQKTGSSTGKLMQSVTDSLLWYAKSIQNAKTQLLRIPKYSGDLSGDITPWLVEDSEVVRKLNATELANPAMRENLRVFQPGPLNSQHPSATRSGPFIFQGEKFFPPQGRQWTYDPIVELPRLSLANRLIKYGHTLRVKMFVEDAPFKNLTNVWMDTQFGGFSEPQTYVVQTGQKTIERCVLMTTDPGDLVLDPTCVRAGTQVWVASTKRTPLNPPVNGGKSSSPSPLAGRVGVGLVAIEDIRPGDWVYAHDGQAHRALRVTSRRYAGVMIGLRHTDSAQNLWLTEDHLVLVAPRERRHRPMPAWREIPGSHFQRAREMRRAMTPSEQCLWRRLRSEQLGVKFRRQHPVGPFIADFYARDAALVVEVDGSSHFETPEAADYDARRDHYMTSLGLRVLRFTNQQAMTETDGVLQCILDACRTMPDAPEHGCEWRRAGDLRPEDSVYSGIERQPSQIAAIEREQTEEEVYDLEVDGAHSFLTEVCAIHNCGSGTTAFVAEEWGRRWITIDTSRVALALARTRLMAAKYAYYLLADSPEGIKKESELTGQLPPPHKPESDIRKGFVYKRVPHVTLKSIANNSDIKEGMTRAEIDAAIARHAESETLYDQPYEDNKTIRVAGPFTVESLSPHRTVDGGECIVNGKSITPPSTIHQSDFTTMILDNLRKAGVQNTKKGERLKFDRLDPFAGSWIHAAGEYTEGGSGVPPEIDTGKMPVPPKVRRVAISIGPEHGTVGPQQVKEAAKEAVQGVGFDVLIVCGFAFDPHVSEEAKRYGKLTVLAARMNPDLAMGDELLKKTGAGNLFMVFGEPDVVVDSEEWIVDRAGKRVVRYEQLKRLSGLGSLEEINRVGRKDPSYFQRLSARGTVRADVADTAGSSIHSGKHRGGIGKKRNEGVHPVPGSGSGIGGGTGDADRASGGVRLSDQGAGQAAAGGLADHTQDALRPDEIAALQALTAAALPLSTIHFSQVTILGLDVYDPTTGEIRSSSTDDIACWFIDTDYNGESFFVRHAYFTGAEEPYERLKRALRAEIDESAWASLYSTQSRPFDPPSTGKIAIKVINHYGDEVLKVFEIKP